jgi:bifunctional UDP-N-acetylglucosamine pyrophosphorylase/glucosamine-1-phosphate N-acetyltransferase
VKNSVILEQSSIGHIAYVGDSVIGSHCEIGAGVITSNYRFDERPIEVLIKNRRYNSGMQKLGAFIGDIVKIGVNASLCPGCKIGANSWIEPGIMVSQNIPEHKYVSTDRKIQIRNQKHKQASYE